MIAQLDCTQAQKACIHPSCTAGAAHWSSCPSQHILEPFSYVRKIDCHGHSQSCSTDGTRNHDLVCQKAQGSSGVPQSTIQQARIRWRRTISSVMAMSFSCWRLLGTPIHHVLLAFDHCDISPTGVWTAEQHWSDSYRRGGVSAIPAQCWKFCR